MNWKRIWTGTLLAWIAVAGIGYIIHHVILASAWSSLMQSGLIRTPPSFIVPIILLQDFAIGFILTWLYALVRPRLGPGPKTATLTAAIAWFLLYGPSTLRSWMWLSFPAEMVWLPFVGGFLQCWVASYLAGWQYMEKAP